MKKKILICAVFVWQQAVAHAQLVYDQTFGTGGVASHSIGDFSDITYAMEVQADGKILMAGIAYEGSNANFAVCRLNPDGSLDQTFNGTGKRISDYGTTEDVAYTLAVNDQNGKIYVSGYFANDGGYDFLTQALNPDGSTDMDFLGGLAGYTYFSDFNTYDEYAFVSIVQPDGKILLAGEVSGSAGICRLNPDGLLDNTFDYNGYKIIDFLSEAQSHVRGINLQSDGKILLSGYVIDASGTYIVLIRLLPGGLFDDTFSDDGKMFIPHGSNDFGYGNYSVAQQSDGKIVMAGSNGNGADNFIVIRLNADGTLDNTFSGDGKYMVYGSTSGPIGDVLALQDDGKIVVVTDNRIVRIDPSTQIPQQDDIQLNNFAANQGPRAVAIQPDGKIVCAGAAGNQGVGEFRAVRVRNSMADIDENPNPGIKFFPNPTPDKFAITAPENHFPLLMGIYGPTGSLLRSEKITDNNQQVDISDLPGGCYYIRLKQGNTYVFENIIIKL